MQLFIWDAEGTSLLPLSSGFALRSVDWTPDGTSLLLQSKLSFRMGYLVGAAATDE